MKTRKNNDGTVTIRMTYSDLCALSQGYYEKMKDSLEESKNSDSEYMKEIYEEWADVAEQKMRKTNDLFHWAIEQQHKNK